LSLSATEGLQHCLSKYPAVALSIGIFVLPTLIYTYCFIIYKAKDAKVSFEN